VANIAFIANSFPGLSSRIVDAIDASPGGPTDQCPRVPVNHGPVPTL
jgi:hypothetical protein